MLLYRCLERYDSIAGARLRSPGNAVMSGGLAECGDWPTFEDLSSNLHSDPSVWERLYEPALDRDVFADGDGA